MSEYVFARRSRREDNARRRPLGAVASAFKNLDALVSVKAPVLARTGAGAAATASKALATQATKFDGGPGTNGTMTAPDGTVTNYHVNTDGSTTVLSVMGGPGAPVYGGGDTTAPPADPPPVYDDGSHYVTQLPAAPASSSTGILLAAAAAAAFFFLRKH